MIIVAEHLASISYVLDIALKLLKVLTYIILEQP